MSSFCSFYFMSCFILSFNNTTEHATATANVQFTDNLSRLVHVTILSPEAGAAAVARKIFCNAKYNFDLFWVCFRVLA